MKESELIKNLSAGLDPFAQTEKLSPFLVKWSAYTLFIMFLAYLFLPARSDITTEVETVRFHIENLLWFVASLSSGIAFYFSAFPQRMNSRTWVPALFSISLLFILIMTGLRPSVLNEELHQEFSLWRGRCGFIILCISVIHSIFLGNWAKKAAPRNAGVTGFWAALSASSLGCLFMQVVCTHHTTMHLMVWHFVPMALICFIGQKVGQSVLRW